MATSVNAGLLEELDWNVSNELLLTTTQSDLHLPGQTRTQYNCFKSFFKRHLYRLFHSCRGGAYTTRTTWLSVF
jgi:hypothetical protein